MPCKIKTVAVLRFLGGAVKRNPVRSEPRCGPFLDTAEMERDGVKAMGQRMTEERVDCTILLERS
jgi:hypothetical protein